MTDYTNKEWAHARKPGIHHAMEADNMRLAREGAKYRFVNIMGDARCVECDGKWSFDPPHECPQSTTVVCGDDSGFGDFVNDGCG